MGVLAEDIERKIVERARNGDRSAMKQIYDCYVTYLTATCSRYLPDKGELRDVLQDSFVSIFSSLDKFTYRGEGSLKAWMRQVSVNEALKKIRKRKSFFFQKRIELIHMQIRVSRVDREAPIIALHVTDIRTVSSFFMSHIPYMFRQFFQF